MLSSSSHVSLMDKVCLYNTLSRKKEQFKPMEPNKVKFYRLQSLIMFYFNRCSMLVNEHSISHTTAVDQQFMTLHM